MHVPLWNLEWNQPSKSTWNGGGEGEHFRKKIRNKGLFPEKRKMDIGEGKSTNIDYPSKEENQILDRAASPEAWEAVKRWSLWAD